ncbi:MAG: hypothetical protein M5R36_18970 [Deltaproteobacteria bacterium]|nr:hypothetical protein [Deltaproteobacteria bacterium]
MDRLACVDVAALPLQLFLRRQEKAAEPAAVVAEDKPQAPVLWVNPAAWREGVRPGQLYARALDIAPGLSAGAIPDAELRETAGEIFKILERYSPVVEMPDEEPGVFWMDASGLGRLFTSAGRWARAIRGDLRGAGFSASLAVGYRRFAVYAVAKARRGVSVFADPEAETRAMREVPLSRMPIDFAARERLTKLNILTLGSFMDLPVQGVRRRFGLDLAVMHQRANGFGRTAARARGL